MAGRAMRYSRGMIPASRLRQLDAMVFVGTHGHVVALRRRDGETLWTTSLPSTGYSVVSILVEEDQLVCASGGRVFGLDPFTGEIRWDNGLPGMGTGQVYLATRRSSTHAMPLFEAESAAQQSSAATAPPTY